MRIVIDCRCVFTGCGGIGRYARTLVAALAAVDDYDDLVVLRSEHRRDGPIVERDNVREWTVPAAMLDWDYEQLQLPELLDELGAELYHNPTFSLPVVRACPQVATMHDVVFRDRPELVRPGLRDYLDRASEAASRAGDRLITVSEYSKGAHLRALRGGSGGRGCDPRGGGAGLRAALRRGHGEAVPGGARHRPALSALRGVAGAQEEHRPAAGGLCAGQAAAPRCPTCWCWREGAGGWTTTPRRRRRPSAPPSTR